MLLGKENNSGKTNTVNRLVRAKHWSCGILIILTSRRRKLRLGEVVSFAEHHRQLLAEGGCELGLGPWGSGESTYRLVGHRAEWRRQLSHLCFSLGCWAFRFLE